MKQRKKEQGNKETKEQRSKGAKEQRVLSRMGHPEGEGGRGGSQGYWVFYLGAEDWS